MFTNYLKIAFRNLLRNKIYSFINIFGLTLGLTCFLLIALYIFDELTFDRFHRNADNIYRLIEHKTSTEGRESKVAATAFNLSAHANSNFPEVAGIARLSMLGRGNILNDENRNTFYESYYLLSKDFLTVFDFKLLDGDGNTALTNPGSAIITEETALKLFGNRDVVGKTLRTDRDSLPVTITAVLANFPSNSHLRFNIAFSESTMMTNQGFRDFMQNDWSSNTFISYLQLKDKADPGFTAEKLGKLALANRTGIDVQKSEFQLQPLANIHFYSENIEGDFDGASIFYIYVFFIVGLFVLLIACINYMNLTTARFASRGKEIAIRKVAGAARKHLVMQFLSEALLMTLMALILALITVNLMLPAFNHFTEKQLALNFQSDYRIWVGVVLVMVFVGILSGLYPALFQSGLKPLALLKNKINPVNGAFSMRRMLVVFQFALSIIMIIATIVVYLQLQYVNRKDMGFNKEQLVVVDINSGSVRRSAETIKSEFAKIPGVKTVSTTSRVPGEWKVLPKVKVKTGNSSSGGNEMSFIGVDHQFLKTFEVSLVKGRNLSHENPADSSAVMINESAAVLMGITTPTEQQISIPSIDFSGNISTFNQPFKGRVVGIVKDFNYRSLRETVSPLILAYQRNPVHNIDYFTSRVSPVNIPKTLAAMEAVLHKIDPEHLFEYNFLEKQWDLFYREDQKRQTIFISVALMTILIACLGLFGLATYAARQRIKEIGIRKVLGASVSGIVTMLSKDFLQLVLIAAFIAFPLAWWGMKTWLNDFAYRIDISWWIFVVAAVIALLIAFFTISFQAVKAAVSNPVKSLRTE